jgi:hypothetical protein
MLINSPNISGSLTVTGNIVATGSLTVSGTISGTVAGTTATASYVEYTNVANKPALVSGSSQITYSGLTGVPSGIVSGSSQVIYSGLSSIPSGIVSGSAQVAALGYATTSSNIFQANQIITGSLFISQNLVVAGSSSIQYISSSVVDIADNIITVNAFNPGVRFGGLAVIDSGSSPQVSGSMLFDSIKDQWIFVHQNQSVVTSSVVLMGPETYNDLGNEAYISANRLPKGSGVEHLRDSNITDTGTVVSVNSNTAVTGSFTVVTGSAVELQVTNLGVNMGSALTDSHIISGSLRVNPNGLFVSGSGNVGIGTTSPSFQLDLGGGTTNNTRLRLQRGSDDTAQNALYGWNSITIQRTNVSLSSAQTDFSIIQQGSDGSRTPFYISSGGNVGIGTTSPNRLTELISSSGGVLGVSTSANGSSVLYGRIAMYSNAGSNSYIDYGGEIRSYSGAGIDYSDLRFYTAGGSTSSERMRITSGGALLLGTSSSTNVAPGRIVNRTGGTSDPDSILNNGAWSNAIIGGEPALYLSSNIVAATGAGSSSQTAKGGIGFEYYSSTLPTELSIGIFGTPTVSSNVRFWNGTERMRITSGGSVLIGTSTDAGARLQVEGGNFRFNWANPSADYYLWLNRNSTRDGGILLTKDNTLDWQIVNISTSGNLVFYSYGSTSNVLTLTRATGAATFSSSVTTTFLRITDSAGEIGEINSTNANGGYITWRTSGTTIADLGTAQQIFGSGGNDTFGINGRGTRALVFGTNNTERLRITSGGTVQPGANGTQDLGSTSFAWANIYTNDLHLSNMGKEGGNDIDGTSGTWTIQEGAEDLYIINNRNNKKFKIKLEEII